MRINLRLVGVVFGALLTGPLLGSLGGCSTVVFSENTSTQRAAAVEREALIDAASQVAKTKWPHPQNASWQARFISMSPGGERLSQSETINAYLNSLSSDQSKPEQVLADAQGHLAAASALARAANAAAGSIRPVKADVAIVEEAIGDLRDTRDIYVASLKSLAKHGEPVQTTNVRELKSEFDDAIRELGAAADLLADRVDGDQTETFAAPGPNVSRGSL
ncbi:MAG: hypothetical protein R3C54_06780 [Parvularculaceae bacterium]